MLVNLTPQTVSAGMIGAFGFPLSRQEFGAVEGLPEPKEGVFYIVSTLVESNTCVERLS